MDAGMIRVIAVPVVAALFAVLPVKLQQKQLLQTAFWLWMIGGIALLVTGAFRLSHVMHEANPLWLWGGSALAVMIGIAKGKFVLSKTSRKNIERFYALEGPQKLSAVYSVRSWVIIGIMLLISASLTWCNAPDLTRGIVNIAVGLALITSSMAYVTAQQHSAATPSEA